MQVQEVDLKVLSGSARHLVDTRRCSLLQSEEACPQARVAALRTMMATCALTAFTRFKGPVSLTA
jgi:hypothetical protein